MANQREDSKKDWLSKSTIEEINAGSLQRIADASEKMATNYTQLQNDLALYKKWYFERGERLQKLERRISALRGVITKLKRNN